MTRWRGVPGVELARGTGGGEDRLSFVVSRRIRVEDFVVTEVVLPAANPLSEHRHRVPRIFIAREGLVRAVIGGHAILFRRGATLVRAPGTIRFGVAGTRPARLLVVDFGSNVSQRFARLFPHGVASCQISPAATRDIPFRILDEVDADDPASKLAIQGLLLQLLSLVGRSWANRSVERAPAWLARTIELVESSYQQPLSLHDLASAVSRHPTGVAREFRRVVGVSVGERIRELRFEYAAQELLASNRSIASIASSAGYADQSHLAREFHKRARTSPTAFRRSRGAEGSAGESVASRPASRTRGPRA